MRTGRLASLALIAVLALLALVLLTGWLTGDEAAPQEGGPPPTASPTPAATAGPDTSPTPAGRADTATGEPAAGPTEESASPAAATSPSADDAGPTPDPAGELRLTGSGNDVVVLGRPLEQRVALRISGNEASEYFAVRWSTPGDPLTRGIVATTEPYDGTRALFVDEPVDGFEVEATGDWAITLVPIDELPVWDATSGPRTGSGDDVLLVTGWSAPTMEVTGNEAGEFFAVRVVDDDQVVDGLLAATRAVAGAVPIGNGVRAIEVEATGAWSIAQG